ncbi:ankyrin repeat-containing protein BDA1-like [Durio zibethinus]|uniref:Ankyrin repeat-containing protein BDA1-like n=1 Tax=Durio zibethinus TaxID=66656 RepID=A0A6P5Z5L3_DURZI|nr:ankyrin repeat-containing protein BDA1-like [Durio zibethinus]
MAQPESVAITIHPPSTEDNVMGASRSDDIDTLYQLIGEDVDVWDRINMRKFVDTPLHIAAAAGHTYFAMEMMYLQPSFATKLNKDGLSTLHLALQNGHTRFVLSLLKINGSLVSVKGKMGYTPLHYLVMKETDGDLLTEFLNDYPDCIHHVTSRDETALHVAARNNQTALKVLLRWLRRTNNSIARCRKNESLTLRTGMIIRLIKDLRVDIKAINSKSSTALDILNGQAQGDYNINIKKCVDILRHGDGLKASARKIPLFCLEVICQCAYELRVMPADSGNALLVVATLC